MLFNEKSKKYNLSTSNQRFVLTRQDLRVAKISKQSSRRSYRMLGLTTFPGFSYLCPFHRFKQINFQLALAFMINVDCCFFLRFTSFTLERRLLS